ncbi:NAD(P)/FAD-dependent oxidoreductase [Lysinibacillus sp. FSL K6-0232]|uniref:NAD(P)/FAD-dependent oxidoreductase n=1 Tax=unclassified Lysinibacillus TaxID=2636778 RepID=UPI0030FC55F8
MNKYDCIVIGGGPAGLSAALTLGRACRKVALFDNETNRNRVTQTSHGFLTRDGITPLQFKSIAMKELEAYPTISVLHQTVIAIKKEETNLFLVQTANNESYLSEKILLATGIQEEFFLAQIRQYYGKSLFSCPYCDGWEQKEKALAILAEDEEHILHMTKLVYNWSRDLMVFTNGNPLSDEVHHELERRKIKIYTATIKNLHGEHGNLQSIELATGDNIARSGGFVVPSFMRPNKFAEQLHCQFDENQCIITDGTGQTTVSGVYIAGETKKAVPSSLMIAAAEGFQAAVSINMDLIVARF